MRTELLIMSSNGALLALPLEHVLWRLHVGQLVIVQACCCGRGRR